MPRYAPDQDESDEPAPKNDFKAPKLLAQAADRYYTIRQERLAKEKEAEKLKAEEAFLKKHIIDTLPKSQAGGIAGKVCRVEITQKHRWSVSNWEKVWAYCAKNRAKGGFAILQKKLSPKACEEIFVKTGKPLDGLEKFDYPDLSVSKL
jgi:hypothetical protein